MGEKILLRKKLERRRNEEVGVYFSAVKEKRGN